MTLRALDTDLWVADHPLVVPGGLAVGTRMTVVRLRDGSLWLHSPIPLDAPLRSELDALGPVRHLVAPNKLHHFYVKDAAAAYPEARVHLAPGLAEKVRALPAGAELEEAAPEAWSGEIDQVLVEGAPFVNEVAFLHRASRTLVLTDLAFNVHEAANWATRLFWRANGALGRFGPTRMVKLTLRRKADVRRSIDRILAWDFDRVTVTHGDVLETGGHEAFRAAYAWLPGAAAARPTSR